MIDIKKIKKDWFSNIRADILAGIVVALALIPESIAFSIIAGVDPKVGLYASFCIAIVIAFVGGRPGMISAATGAMALVMVNLVKEHGLDYLLLTTVLTGVIQVLAGFLRLGSLIRFVSKSVITGFVNALAILLFMAQLPEFTGQGFYMYFMVALGLVIIYGFPYINKTIPSPLVAIIILTVISLLVDIPLRTVGDMGKLPSAFPVFLLPNVPLNLETLFIVLPYAITLAAVGLLESLLTAIIVDDLTVTSSLKNKECCGQGIANIVAGFFGGMAGCAMIGQSVINFKSGGRGRLSTFVAGVFLIFLILVLAHWVKQIPMASLVAVMFMVSIGTFDWSSIKKIHKNPKSSSLVMVTTVCVVVATHNLALGVFIGVLMSALFFSNKVSQLMYIQSNLDDSLKKRSYKVYGQVFFASADQFEKQFNINEEIDIVDIDMTQAHLWDLTGVHSLDKIVLRFRNQGILVNILGMNEASKTLVEKIAIQKKLPIKDILFS